MQLKIIVSTILLMFLHSANCKSQESFYKILKSSKDKIAEIEKLGYKVIHLDLDILNSSEKEETRISLNTGYRYIIAACGDQDRIKTVQIELFQEIENKKTLIQKGRDGIAPSGSSVIKFIPEKDNSYLITVFPKEFTSGNINTGRYYLIVASKSSPIEIKSIQKQDAKFNLNTQKLGLKDLTDNSSTFRIYKVENYIEHEIDPSTTIKYEIEMNYTDETNMDKIKYQVKDLNGKKYSIEVDTANKSVLILELPGRNNIFSGTRYISK